jgi:putative membrane protein
MVYDIWHWHPDPEIIDGVIATTALYYLAIGPGRSWLAPGKAYPWQKAICFALGTLALLLAVVTPLDEISETYLFSAHMLQHIILIYPVALFWLWGMPDWLLRPLVEMEWSRPLIRFFTIPLVAFLVFNGMFYVWHLPPLYEWALRDSKIHLLEHASFMVTAMLMWWPLVHPLPEMPRFHAGGQMLYLLAGSIVQMPLFGFLAFGETVFYPTYLHAPRLIGWLDPLADQQLGAVIMKISAMLVMFGALVVVFTRWYIKEESGRKKKLPAPSL